MDRHAQETPALLRLSVTATALFLAIGLMVFHGPGNDLDLWFTERVATIRTDTLTEVFSAATFIGNTDTLVVLSLALLAVAAVHRPSRRELVLLVTLLIAVGVASPLLKHMYARPRPPPGLALRHETSFSFPSGHAMVSICLFGFLAYLAQTHLDGRRRHAALSLTAVMAVAIGFSRVYLGVHYACDVLAGYLAGLPLLAATVVAYRRAPAPVVDAAAPTMPIATEEPVGAGH